MAAMPLRWADWPERDPFSGRHRLAGWAGTDRRIVRGFATHSDVIGTRAQRSVPPGGTELMVVHCRGLMSATYPAAGRDVFAALGRARCLHGYTGWPSSRWCMPVRQLRASGARKLRGGAQRVAVKGRTVGGDPAAGRCRASRTGVAVGRAPVTLARRRAAKPYRSPNTSLLVSAISSTR